MRILQIFNRYSSVGGEEIAVEQISAELAAHHEFRAITFDSKAWAAERGGLSRLRQFLAMAYHPASIREVRRQIEEFRPEVILLHNLMPVGSAALYWYLSRCGVPLVHYIHNFRPFSVNGYCWGRGRLLPQGVRKNFLPEILAGSWQDSRLKTAWYAVLLWGLHACGVFRRMDGWIAISRFMKRTFVEGGIEGERIKVISHSWEPQCGDAEAEELAAMEPGEPVFLFLGRLTEEKGLRVLLDAWARYVDSAPAGRLVIAGDGPLREEVEARCARLRGASCVGFQSGEEKKRLLRECTALVVPSVWWEPLGLVLYEAYDFGKPVLAARSGGILDHVEDGVTGWLHDAGDDAALAAHMREAAEGRDLCRERGSNGRNRLSRQSAKAWIERFDEFVGGVIARHADVGPKPEASPSMAGKPLRMQVYLADQSRRHGRSLGISRMTEVVLAELAKRRDLELSAISSSSSILPPSDHPGNRVLPWPTRRAFARVLTDHLHPCFANVDSDAAIYYFPKGFLPLVSGHCRPSVVTVHDTIIQHDQDRYPKWRSWAEYAYWSEMLKHTLRQADGILTVSQTARRQILEFMERHGLPAKGITVTYEPCAYESVPQPARPAKEEHVLHLASTEPHKRTAHLIRWWLQAEAEGRKLPVLQLIGTVPPEVLPLLSHTSRIVRRPFLEDAELQSAYRSARALIFPSEIEGFGLPAVEAYYLGTPVCFVKDTSVEEVLGVATSKGGFSLDDPASLTAALDEVLAMTPEEVYDCGLRLRQAYAVEKVSDAMMAAFRKTARAGRARA